MSLLDTVETNKQLENNLDSIVYKELQEHYNRADQVAFDIRAKFHDSDKGKDLSSYNFYRIENMHLSTALENIQEELKQYRQEISNLYANKTTLLELIGEMLGVISHNSTESQNNILMQTLKRELDVVDFARVKAYVKRLQ